MYVCGCVHACVCVCVCVSACAHPNTCICAHTWINACMCLPVCSLQAFLLSQHVPRDLYKHCTFSHSDILNASYCIIMWYCAMLQDVITDIAFTCSCSCLAIVDCWDMKTGLWVIFFPVGKILPYISAATVIKLFNTVIKIMSDWHGESFKTFETLLFSCLNMAWIDGSMEWLHSVLMPACKSNSKWLSSQSCD